MPRNRQTYKLTQTSVANLRAPDPSGKQKLYWDSDLKGFGVLVSGVTNTKSYVVQHDVRGGAHSRRISIGPTNVLSVDDARAAAIDLISQMMKGIDPKLEAKTAKARSLTVRQALENYLRENRKLRPKSRKDYRTWAQLYLASWMDKPLAEITRDMVEQRHQDIPKEIQRGVYRSPGHTIPASVTGYSSANSAIRTLQIIWNWAKERDTLGLPERNPAKVHRNSWYPEPRREGLVRASDLPAFYQAVTEVQNTVYRDYLLLVLFTGLRRTEAATLMWEDIDLRERIIRLPAIRTKAGRRLDLPMSDYLYDLLVARRAEGMDGPYVFPARTRSGDRTHLQEPRLALDEVAEKTGIKITIHDLRRTFITVAESCDIPVYALKGLVNHSMGTDVTAGYVVAGPERLRAPMQKVTDRFKALIGLTALDGDQVIAMRGRDANAI
jgi:integrase